MGRGSKGFREPMEVLAVQVPSEAVAKCACKFRWTWT